MGSSRYTHVGPYLRIEVAKESREETKAACPRRCTDYVSPYFKHCPHCGSEIESTQTQRDYYPSLDDLTSGMTEEPALDESFFSAMKADGEIIAIPNDIRPWVEERHRAGDGDWEGIYYNLSDPLLPEKMIAEMKKRYSGWIMALSKRRGVLSIEPLFGVVTYYM